MNRGSVFSKAICKNTDKKIIFLRGGGIWKMDGWSDTSEEEEGGEEEEDEEEGDDFSNDELEEDEEDDSASARLWEPKSAMYGACRLLQSFALKFLALFMCFKIFSSLGVSGWSRVVGIIVILSRLLVRSLRFFIMHDCCHAYTETFLC